MIAGSCTAVGIGIKFYANLILQATHDIPVANPAAMPAAPAAAAAAAAVAVAPVRL